MNITGTTTALITPFTEDVSKVDFAGLETLVERQLEAGIDCILPLGTTGETPTLSAEEKDAVLSAVVKQVDGKIPVMVGTGAYSTSATIAATQRAKDLGADIALIVSPYYNKPSQAGLLAHFEKVCTAVNIPTVVYNIRGRTGVNIETPTLKKMAALPNIIGVKEASGDLAQVSAVLQEIQCLNDTFSAVSGDDALTLPMMALGARGVISVASNLVPKEVVSLVKSLLKGDLESARKQHFALLNLFDALFVESNPVPVKTALTAWGLPAGGVRLPLVAIQEESQQILSAAMESFSRY